MRDNAKFSNYSQLLLQRDRLEEEIEEADARALEDAKAVEADTYEPARPGDVPVLWERPARDEARGTVLPFRRPGSADDPPR